MAEIARIDIPPQTYPSGERTLGPVAVPRRVDALELTVTRAAVTGDPILTVRIEALVGGQWREAGGFQTSCRVGPSWPGPGDSPIGIRVVESAGVEATQVRLRATLSGGSARIGGTVIALGG